jgi:hypothetical protein
MARLALMAQLPDSPSFTHDQTAMFDALHQGIAAFLARAKFPSSGKAAGALRLMGMNGILMTI